MRHAACASIAALALMAGACSSDQKTVPASSLAPVTPTVSVMTLPDLSKLVPAVQSQIRDQHATVQRTLENRASSTVDQANAYGQLGKLLMAAQLPDAAERALQSAETLNPADHRWPYYLAHLYRTQGDLAKSASFFQRVLQLRPEDVDALVWLGDVSLAAGSQDAAEPAFAKALELEPTSVSARYGMGRVALAKNEHARAAEFLEEVLRRDPKASAAHYPLALAYSGLGNSAKAEQHLRQRRDTLILPADPLMVELDSLLQSPQTFESLGIRALNKEDWTEAEAQFRKGLAMAPDNAALHHRLGTVFSMKGDQAAARAEFQTAVRLSPDYFPAQFSLGVMAQAAGRHSEAIGYFIAALKARPDYTEAQLRLASSQRRAGQATDALQTYTQVRSRQPDSPEATMGYAMTLTKLRRDAEARDVLAAAMDASGGQTLYAHALARLLASSPDAKVRDGARALALLQPILQRERSLDLGETYAMALAETGQYREAQAIQRDLTAAAGRAGLASVKRRLEQRQALYDRADPCRTPWTDEEMP